MVTVLEQLVLLETQAVEEDALELLGVLVLQLLYLVERSYEEVNLHDFGDSGVIEPEYLFDLAHL